MNSIKQYFTFKKIIIFLGVAFFILFLVGGCSFKYMDWQYYEFKKLCANVDSEVVIHNQDYFDIIKNHKNIETDDKGCFYSEKLQQEICFGNFDYKGGTEFERGNLSKVKWELWYSDIHYATQIGYNYKYFGLWLQGNEAAGFYIELANDLSSCSCLKKIFDNS